MKPLIASSVMYLADAGTPRQLLADNALYMYRDEADPSTKFTIILGKLNGQAANRCREAAMRVRGRLLPEQPRSAQTSATHG
jgi:hypothetical protein